MARRSVFSGARSRSGGTIGLAEDSDVAGPRRNQCATDKHNSAGSSWAHSPIANGIVVSLGRVEPERRIRGCGSYNSLVMAVAATSHTGGSGAPDRSSGDQRHIVITKSPFTLGRADGCDATIADLKISRQHAQLVNEGAEYYIVDCGSRHGTFVNGSRCSAPSSKIKMKSLSAWPG